VDYITYPVDSAYAISDIVSCTRGRVMMIYYGVCFENARAKSSTTIRMV